MQVSQASVLRGVGVLVGQELPCGVQVPLPYVLVERVGEWCDVGDADDPLVGVETGGFTGETELEGPVGERPEEQVAFGVPLHSARSPFQLAPPGGAVGVEPVLVAGQAGVFQCPLEAFTGDLDGEDGFLAFSWCPIRSGTSSTGTTA